MNLVSFHSVSFRFGSFLLCTIILLPFRPNAGSLFLDSLLTLEFGSHML